MVKQHLIFLLIIFFTLPSINAQYLSIEVGSGVFSKKVSDDIPVMYNSTVTISNYRTTGVNEAWKPVVTIGYVKRFFSENKFSLDIGSSLVFNQEIVDYHISYKTTIEIYRGYETTFKSFYYNRNSRYLRFAIPIMANYKIGKIKISSGFKADMVLLDIQRLEKVTSINFDDYWNTQETISLFYLGASKEDPTTLRSSIKNNITFVSGLSYLISEKWDLGINYNWGYHYEAILLSLNLKLY